MRPTIEDVARIAGVSTATVSRTLHFPDRVSPRTAERVTSAVRATGYSVNVAAQTLRQRRANAILVIVPNIGNTFYGEVLAGAEETARKTGQTMLIGDSGDDPAREAALLAYLRNGRADGVLMLARPGIDWNLIPGDPETGLRPVVMISETPVDARMPHVRVDNFASSAELVGHLIDLGHRSIAHVTGPDTTGLTGERREGYFHALARAGLHPAPGAVIRGDFSAASGARAAVAILSLDPRPTAVFCANDEMAMGLIGTLARHGVRVPQDMSVAGYDDIQFAEFFVPALTTVRQPRRAMGDAAIRLMNAILGRDVADGVSRILPYDLVLRDSTAPPPARAARISAGAADRHG